MDRLSSLKTSLARIFDEYPNPCLWLSGGADSLLLLRVMLEADKQFGVLRFDDGWDRDQRKQVDAIVQRFNLMVFSYPPVMSLLTEENGEIAAVAGYAVDRFGTAALLVRDLVEEVASGESRVASGKSRCVFDIKTEMSPGAAAQIEFDAHIWGTRREDRHWIAGDDELIKSDRWSVGEKQFFAPLYDWTRDEVLEALKTFEEHVPELDTGNIVCCSRCLKKNETARVFCPKADKEIPKVEWNREENLRLVRDILRSNK